ncbi:MAG: hypothetical protein ACI9LM_000780 [Alteromonadaceae bacterium]|jgi:hypothetical protein
MSRIKKHLKLQVVKFKSVTWKYILTTICVNHLNLVEFYNILDMAHIIGNKLLLIVIKTIKTNKK